MRTVNIANEGTPDIGHQYDNLATQVLFPSSVVSAFTETYGEGGTFHVWYRKSGDVMGSIIDDEYVTQDGTTVRWLVASDALTNPGISQIQLRYEIGDRHIMGTVYSAIVNDSVDIE